MIKKLLLVCGLGLFCSAQCGDFRNIQNSLIFLSPGVSGTHLTMLNIYIATKRPVFLIKPNDHLNKYNPLKLKFAKGSRPYYHTHNPPHVNFINRESNQLIVIIRNYKDWILRKHIALLSKRKIAVPIPLSAKTCKRIYSLKGPPKNYYKYLLAFDRWPEKNRLLLYYEDLIDQPLESLKKIQQFLGVESSTIEEDMALLADLNIKSKQYYNTKLAKYGGSRSGGKSTGVYTTALTTQDLEKVDKRIRQVNPVLFDRYLSRYVENE